MSVLSEALQLRKYQEEQIAWKLLRASHASAIIAILDSHLGAENRRLLISELVELVDADLEELRFRGGFELGRSAQEYCEQWRKDGYLVRRPLGQTRQETYELSAGAMTAIAFAKRMIQPHRTATQSRLNTIITQINELALSTDSNEERRRSALLEERHRIDEQLSQIDEGEVRVINAEQALEQTLDIINLAQGIPEDFVHVKGDFERITRMLHTQIISYEEGYQDVLEDIFNGVDQIAQSPSGRSFKGFYSLLRDTDMTETLQDNIDLILDNQFSDNLSLEQRRFLRNLLKTFLDQSQEANQTMTTFSQTLRRFVQSQEYLRERRLNQQIDQILVKANILVGSYPAYGKIGEPLNLTSMRIMPISRWRPKNPAEMHTAEMDSITLEQAPALSYAELIALAREIEIDFRELVQNVNSVLSGIPDNALKGISIGSVLSHYPATQGLASVVGLLVLATEQGRESNQSELITWTTRKGQERKAHINRWEFFRKVSW